MQANTNARRAYGSGSILTKGSTYYGKWRVGDRQIMRKLGPVRQPGTREGLTRTIAEAKLRSLMAEITASPVAERVTVETAGTQLLAHLEAMGRKPSTLRSYRSQFRHQIAARIGERPVARVDRQQVEELVEAWSRDGLSPKTIRNILGLLNGTFEFAIRRGWATENPCRHVDRPRAVDEDDRDIRFLDQDELEAVLRAAATSSASTAPSTSRPR